MNIVEFTEYLVKELVTKPDLVTVKEFEENDERVIQILVSEDDISKLIGKDGNTINAVRTIIQSSTYLNNEKRVKINVDSF